MTKFSQWNDFNKIEEKKPSTDLHTKNYKKG